IEATGALEELRLKPGERLQQAAARLYIVTSGQGQLVREGPGGHEILLGVLGPGNVMRDGGTLVADTPVELLALPNGKI
ncbi:MAG TPA: cyclic nucleotide-binding domain-containing protein, partial [Chloroflexota bacterium]|nr:cyclic nucleotide-binding domain-containing protein [Chloroflexota bacterium]